jgi:CHASE3 domain sensor protein
MPWINNLKLMPKLLLTFGVLLLVMLLQGIVAYRGLHSLNNVTTELAGSRMESIRMAGEMRGMLGEYRNAAYQQLIRASDDVKSDAQAGRRAAHQHGQVDQGLPEAGRQRAAEEAVRHLRQGMEGRPGLL